MERYPPEMLNNVKCIVASAAKVSFLLIGSGKAERMKDISNNTAFARILPAFHILNGE